MVKLLAQKFDWIVCEENYQDRQLPGLNPAEFPCLCYTRDLADWHDFIRRTPELYEAWYDGVTKECETLELRILPDLASQGKPVFVDTNIRPETLKTVSDRDRANVLEIHTQQRAAEDILVAAFLGQKFTAVTISLHSCTSSRKTSVFPGINGALATADRRSKRSSLSLAFSNSDWAALFA